MSVRQAVRELVSAGTFPTEDASVEEIAETQRLLECIEMPISDEEAQLLLMAFGPDNCFGLAWTLLHLIESAPSARTADYSKNAGNLWVQLLKDRRKI